MDWEIKTYETARGEKPVDEFLKKLSPKTKARLTHLFDLLNTYGNMLRMTYSKRIDKNLYELRIRGIQEIRVFYCFRGRRIILLHAFRKQTQKTPRKEIEVALKRIDT
ncbi:MAG: type II toxin-antitoxin system RelE/ParE family toxin [Patescibacteria group bacterium]